MRRITTKVNPGSLIALIYFSLWLSGCQVSHQGNSDTDQLILAKRLNSSIIDSQPYQIWALTPAERSSNTLRVYIEGDGRAWLRKGVVSTDPTPRNRLIHRLMMQDAKFDIAYLARPCQFIMNSHCSRDVWTFGRYNKDILQAMNSAVTTLKNQGNYKQLELIGYSGGATLALLIASERSDVTSVRTVAGNLVPDYTNNLHRVSPMPEALNPVDYRIKLVKLPQIHFYGTEDRVIPAAISQYYRQQFSQTHCIQTIAVEKASHSSRWTESWSQLLKNEPACR
ncbi:alpha/beta fold hydrolase [Endozoicomonas sp. OPT23]|uniref:alpha/beta fold hydrolase n=1 Tax=Endozoicomonas sp. OPT23 TaxID=2072845 RepID=UPI0018913A7E|nr:dienelactone hydrolase family protein [Endozoicomonas sp. OPT23]